ncbi:hypothetical protein LLH23_17990 [bacterium]|nr:hypothetical protein [bacterium]
MIGLLRKELRETIWVPLGFVAFMALLTAILYLQHWWSKGTAGLYTMGLWLFVAYMGCEAFAGEGGRGMVEWGGRWPVSRARWWLAKLLTRVVTTCLATVPVALAVVWLSALHPAQSGGSTGLGTLLATLLATVGVGLVTAFFASSITRTSLYAFGLTLVLGYAVAAISAVPVVVGTVLRFSRMDLDPRLSLKLTLAFWLWSVVALLASSVYAFTTAPLLDYGRRAKRGLLAATVLILPVAVLLSLASVASVVLRKPAPQGVMQPQLSPDGRQIAFADGMLGQGVWLVNADGTKLRRLSRQRVRQLCWLKDSRRLLLSNEIETVTRGPGRMLTRSWSSANGQVQWSVLDTQAARPAAQPVYTGGERLYASPQGKYLLIGGQIIEVGTWREMGQVTPPRYEPWLVTWLPDDSAILVREHQQQPYREVLKRIAVPSGAVTEAKLPWRPPGASPGLAIIGADPLSQSTVWFAGDSSTWTPTPRSQQKTVTRTVDTVGRDGKRTQKTVTYRTNTQKRWLKTTFFRLDGGPRFEVAGVEPLDDGLSPEGRYCLVSDGERPYLEEPPRSGRVALLDLASGRVGPWFTLPAATWHSQLEGPVWSPDERRLVLMLEQWEGQQSASKLILLEASGQMRTIPAGQLGGFASGGLVGWTATGEFVMQRDDETLVALTPDGQERTIVQAHSWLTDEMERSRKKPKAPSRPGPGAQP